MTAFRKPSAVSWSDWHSMSTLEQLFAIEFGGRPDLAPPCENCGDAPSAHSRYFAGLALCSLCFADYAAAEQSPD